MQNHIIKKTADGSPTIYLPWMDEQYHSMNGAITESMHVFIENGYLFEQSLEPVVLEVGFGTGLNALLTAIHAEKLKRPTAYYSAEKYPLSTGTIEKLNYGALFSGEAVNWFTAIHSTEWEKMVKISEYFSLLKTKMDVTMHDALPCRSCNIIYFDAFAPDKQPEMWQPQLFKRLADITLHNGILVTYSAKGQVRRDLADAEFRMEKLPGPPGKKEMLRGRKIISNL